MGPKKKSKAQKEAERLQAEEDERKAEILRAKREAERIRKEAEDAKRLKENQVNVDRNIRVLCSITAAISYATRVIYDAGLDGALGAIYVDGILDAHGKRLLVVPSSQLWSGLQFRW